MRFLTRDLKRLAVTSAVVREMDRRAIQEYSLSGIALMEEAGAAAAAIAQEMCPPGAPILILAGSGNNAGDGFVMARLLANCGRSVQVITAADAAQYAGDAATNYRIMAKMAIPVRVWGEAPDVTQPWGLIVDALLGTGLAGELRPPFPAIIAFSNASGAPVLAVDIPSGLDADTGAIHTVAVKAARTVTFALPKKGLFVGEGPRLSGRIVLADIGIPKTLYPTGKSLVDA